MSNTTTTRPSRADRAAMRADDAAATRTPIVTDTTPATRTRRARTTAAPVTPPAVVAPSTPRGPVTRGDGTVGRRQSVHAGCTHAVTPAARAVCRASWADDDAPDTARAAAAVRVALNTVRAARAAR
jgi:hypothetical protein